MDCKDPSFETIRVTKGVQERGEEGMGRGKAWEHRAAEKATSTAECTAHETGEER